METNNDENMLISQRINPNDAQSMLSQALRIAIYDACKGYEAHDQIIQKFGMVQPFVYIKEAHSRHYATLISLMQKYSIEVPINNWSTKLYAPNSYVEGCELAVANEINTIAMYDDLLSYVQEADVRDVFYQLQANAYNNHLPAFRNCVIEHNTMNNGAEGLNQEAIMQKISEYQMMLDDMLSGNLDESKLTGLISKVNLSMTSGAVFGGAAIAFLNNYMKKNNEQE